MCVELDLRRRALAGLQVDDEQPPVVVALEAVNLALQHRATDRDLEILLGCNENTRIRAQPLGQLPDHVRSTLALPDGEPAGTQIDPLDRARESLLQLRRDLLARHTLFGDLLRERVHQRADSLRRRIATRAA